MKTYDELVLEGREVTHFHGDRDHPYKSHQQLRLPQPPLVKAKMSDKQIKLPMDFKELDINNDIISLIYNRISRRVYAGKPMPAEKVRYLCGQDAAGYAENVNVYTAGVGLRSITRGSASPELLKTLSLDEERYFFALAQSVGK